MRLFNTLYPLIPLKQNHTCVNRVELNRSDESQCKEKVPELALLGRLELGGRIESPAAHLQNADTYPTTRSGSRTVS